MAKYQADPIPHPLIAPRQSGNTLRHAPDHLLWFIKRFLFPGELLQILDAPVILQWMAESRRAYVEDSLRRYREITLDHPAQSWFDLWLEN